MFILRELQNRAISAALPTPQTPQKKKKIKKLTGALHIIIAHKQNIGQTSSKNTVSASPLYEEDL